MTKLRPFSQKTSITTLGPADVPCLVRLHGLSFAKPWSEADFRHMLTEPGALGLAAGTPEDAGPAGFAPDGFAIVRAVGDEAEILTLAVSPQYRRRGLGRTLVAAILAHGSARGCARIFLEVAEDNRAAHDLYHGQGFELVGRRAGYYRRAGGPGIDAMVLSCRLGVGSTDSI